MSRWRRASGTRSISGSSSIVTAVPSSSVTVTGKAAALADGAGLALAGEAEAAALADGLGAMLGAVGPIVKAGGEPVPEHAATTRDRTATTAGRRRACAPAREWASNGVLLRAGEEDDGARSHAVGGSDAGSAGRIHGCQSLSLEGDNSEGSATGLAPEALTVAGLCRNHTGFAIHRGGCGALGGP